MGDYTSKGLEEIKGVCMKDGCNGKTTAFVWPGDPMPRKFCSGCHARLIPDEANNGRTQGAATIHSQNRY